MKKVHLPTVLAGLLLITGLTSCHETSDDDTEFDNWQQRNEAFFQQKYQEAVIKIAQQSETLVLTKWSLNDSIATKAEDHIVVEVLEKGNGTESPMYTDSVSVHFRGRTIPTSSSPDGYVIGSSYEGTFYDQTALPQTISMNNATTVDGLVTALQHMHIGDRWMVYIPYQLGFGAAAYTVSSTTGWISTSIPAYTMLIYDVKLTGIQKPNSK